MSDPPPGRGVAGLHPRRVRSGPRDAWFVATAVSVCGAAHLAVGAPWPVPVVAAGLVVWSSTRRVAIVILLVLLAGILADRSLSGLDPPFPTGIAGRVELVGDPERIGAAIRVDVRHDGRRFEAWARGAAALVVAPMSAGETVAVVGTVDPFDDRWPPRLARHVAARLTVLHASRPAAASGPIGWANTIRAAVRDGAAGLSTRDRVLLTGFAVGDDRDQLPEVTDDFRATGLTHLTAVSGQNVAFVLLLVSPLLGRLGPAPRSLVVLCLLGQFGFVTRWEPSVMRAVAMAAVSTVGGLLPGERSRLAALATVVTALVLVDPLLVHSVGFRLSVLASLGIAVLLEPVAARIPGPRWIAEPLALTTAAQVGVGPVLVSTFGSMPLVSLPANLAVGPVAGPLMGWGLLAGPVAGWAGGAVASVLHVPTVLMTGYVAGVARSGAALDVPELGPSAALVVAAVTAAWTLAGRSLGWPVAVIALGVAALIPPAPGFDVHGATLFDDGAGTRVLVLEEPRAERLLAELRRAGVADLELVVLTRGSDAAAEAVRALRARRRVHRVLTPDAAEVASAHTVVRSERHAVGGLVVHTSPRGSGLGVTVRASDVVAAER